MKNIIHSKYFYHVVISVILILTIYVIWNKKNKNDQYEALLGEIGNASTAGGGYSDMKSMSAFNTTYYKGKKVDPLWDTKENIVKKIYDAQSNWTGDDEQSVVDLFRKFKTQRQVSYIAWVFEQTYKKNLYTFLDSFMPNTARDGRQYGTTNYMVQLGNIVKGLPA